MRVRDIERGEIVPVVLDLGAGGDRETEIGKDFGEFVHHLRDGVNTSLGRSRRRQGQIQFFGGQLRIQSRCFHRFLAGGQGIGDGLTGTVDLRTLFLPLFRRHFAQGFQQQRNLALLAERSQADRFQRIAIGYSFNLLQIFVPDRLDVAHHIVPFLIAARLASPVKNPIKKRREIAPRRFFEFMKMLRLSPEHPAPA